MTVDATDAPSGSALNGAGITLPAQPEGRGGFLSDVVVELGYASRDEVERAVGEAREPGKLFERVLVGQGTIDEDELARAIAERNGLPHVDLDAFAIDESASKLIGRDEARRYRALPVAFDTDGTLLVAMADPLDGLAVSDIAAITKSEIGAVVASAERIAELADQLPKRRRFPRAEAGSAPPSPELELEEIELAADEVVQAESEAPAAEAFATDVDAEAEHQIEEEVEVEPSTTEHQEAKRSESLPPPVAREPQAFTVPDSLDELDMPEPVVTEASSQTFELPEPMSAYEAAFGASADQDAGAEPTAESKPAVEAEEASEPEPAAFEPVRYVPKAPAIEVESEAVEAEAPEPEIEPDPEPAMIEIPVPEAIETGPEPARDRYRDEIHEPHPIEIPAAPAFTSAPPPASSDEPAREPAAVEAPELPDDEQAATMGVTETARLLSEARRTDLAAGPDIENVQTGLRDRIVQLVEVAIDDASSSELGRLEDELGKARAASDELSAQLEGFRSRIEELEGTGERLRVAEQEVERLEAERLSNEAALAKRTSEHELERERAEEIEARLCKRLVKAKTRSEDLEQLLDQMVEAIGSAHSTSERMQVLQAELNAVLAEEQPAK